MIKAQVQEIKQTILYLGHMNQKNESVFTGTGCCLNIDGMMHLVTARHVVFDRDANGQLQERTGLYAFCNSPDGVMSGSPINRTRKRGCKWLVSKDDAVDITVIPLVLAEKMQVVKAVPQSLWVGADELVETCQVFYLSYQPGITSVENDAAVKPIMRQGMISRINDDGSFYIDGAAFPGNSGSPVFVMPTAARLTDSGPQLGGDQLGGKFIGVIGSYIHYQDVAVSTQTGRPRIIFEENTGLSLVWSVDKLNEVIGSDECKMQIARIKAGDIDLESM